MPDFRKISLETFASRPSSTHWAPWKVFRRRPPPPEDTDREEPDVWTLFPDGLLVLSQEGVIQRANRHLEETFQYGRRELEGKHFSVLVPEGQRAQSEEFLEKYFLSPRQMLLGGNSGLPGLRKNGERFFAAITLTPWNAREPKVFVAVRDISSDQVFERAARQQGVILRSIIDNLPAQISIKETSGKYYLVNRKFEEFFQLSREEILGRKPDELFPESLAKKFCQLDDHLLDTKVPFHFEETIAFRKHQGEFLSYRFLLPAQLPEAPLICTIRTDITEKNAAENALSELAAIVESSEDAIFSLSPEGKILTSNPAAEKTYGYSSEELIGNSVFMLIPLGHGKTFQEKLKAIRNGERVPAVETTQLRKDNTYFPVSVSLWPIPGPDGALHRISLVCRNISEQENAKALLHQFSRVIEQTADLVMITDRLGSIEYVNPAFEKLTGFTKDEVLGKKPSILKSGLYEEGFYKQLWTEILNGKAFQHDLISRKKDGTFFHTEKTITPLKDSEGDITHFVSTDKDITDKKIAENEYQASLARRQDELSALTNDLKRSNEDLQRFAYVTSHDLQEPLRTIVTFLQLLQRKLSLDEESTAYLNFAIDASKRLKDLIRDILELSRVDRVVVEKSWVNCEQALDDALTNLKGSIAESHAKITHSALPTLLANYSLVTILLQNLVDNAIKFRQPATRPEIHIEASSRENHWLFSVSDNGLGIPDDKRAIVFGLFRRLHLEGNYSGRGIGLSICKRIVEGHGGKIWIENNPLGGSIFCFTLPSRAP